VFSGIQANKKFNELKNFEKSSGIIKIRVPPSLSSKLLSSQ
jgi:hypothetical protein